MAEEVGGIVYEVGMEIQGLKAGASQVESELSKVDSAAAGTSKNLDKLDNQASATGKAFSSLVSIVKNIDATLTKMSASSSQAGSAVQQTSQSAESANQVIAALNSQIALMQQQQMATAVATGRLETSINSVTAAIRDMGQQTTATNQQLTGVDRMIEQLGNQVAILDEQMENGARSAAIFAAQLRAGDGATDSQKAKIADLTGRLYDMRNGTEAATKSGAGFKSIMQQSGYQIQDFIVQVQGGQSALVAFSQQGSQLAGAFGPAGAVVGALIALGTVITGVLITSLNGGKNAMDSLKDAAEAMDKVISVSSNGVAALSDKYAALARTNAEVATLMRNQALLEYNQAIAKIPKAIADAADSFITLGDRAIAAFGGASPSIKNFDENLVALNITTNDWSEAISQANSQGQYAAGITNSLSATVNTLASRFGISQQAAFELAKQLSEVEKTKSPEALQALGRTLQALKSSSIEGQEAINGLSEQIVNLAGVSADAKVRLGELKELTDNLTASQKSLIQQSERNLALSKLEGAERAKLAAQYAAEDAGLAGDDPRTKQLIARAEQTYKNTEAIKEQNKENKAADSAAKRAASQQESIAQKLENLRQKSELSAESTKELSREQAILVAQQSLGAAATQSQIDLAGQYAAKAWDNAAALKAQAEAEKKKKQAEEAYSGLRNQASPVTAVDSKFKEDMANLNAYATLYPQKIAEVEATRSAIEEQYRKQRMEAMWQEWAQQNAATQAAAAAFDAFGQTASNALTGIITGSMSASDALRSIGSTVLNSVINTFVQMGVEWVKAAITGAAAQNAATASVVAVQTAAVGTQVATSTAAAAATTAAWTPAAIMASIASMGAAAKIGLAAVAALSVAAIAGKRKNGGPVTAGSMYEVGENGLPEIFQASNGSQYMIPGNNGSVISNKDMMSGSSSSGIIIYNNVINNTSSQVSTSATDNGDGTVSIQTIVADISENGPIGQAISRNYATNRRATE